MAHEHEQLVIDAPAIKAEMGRAIISQSEATGYGRPDGGDNEWFSPPSVVEVARAVMGGIDLDPASNAIANRVVRATTYYTEQENGLLQDWRGRVFMNPPFGGRVPGPGGKTIPIKRAFMDKLGRHLEDESVPEAVVVSPNDFTPAWGNTIRAQVAAICVMPRHHSANTSTTFWKPVGANDSGGAPSSAYYFGPNADLFMRLCRVADIAHGGVIWTPNRG